MSDFIAKLDHKLERGISVAQHKLEDFKKVAEDLKDDAHRALDDNLEKLEVKIHQQSVNLEGIEEQVDDWAFQRAVDSDHYKDEQKCKKLLDRARHADEKSEKASNKSLEATDKAQKESLRSDVAHADAGIPNPRVKKPI